MDPLRKQEFHCPKVHQHGTNFMIQCQTPALAGCLAIAIGSWIAVFVNPVRAQEPEQFAPALPEKNIVLFITDDESATLGCYGDPIAVTPTIDQLAADGTRFTQAFATTASCSASRSVILSGLHNHLNGQYGHAHHFHKFASYHDVVRLALPRLLSQAGYRTARCGKFHVAPEAVYHFDEQINANERSSVAMAEQCRKFIDKPADKRPFFLYFATTDPHRGGGVVQNSPLKLQPDLFGNLPDGGQYPGVEEVFFDSATVPVPAFLTDSPETRAELVQYYQSCSRIDQGLARLVQILKAAGVYDRTLIVFTSDHGMAFPGAKTTVYDPGLRVPLVVRNPYQSHRGVVSNALVSHVDITPTILDFAGALDSADNRPKHPIDAPAFWKQRGEALEENRNGGNAFDHYHGNSWLGILGDDQGTHHEFIFASHTFHEIQMYYPMRAIRDQKYKLIWNIAYKLDFPFASDLWAASSWQAQFQQGPHAAYGQKTVGDYLQRPQFELFDVQSDPGESVNLAADPTYAPVLAEYKEKLKQTQQALADPWIIKWTYE